MARMILVTVIALAVAGCPEPETRAGQPPVESVDMDTLSWATEGRSVEHGGARWVMVGPPVYEPLALTQVGNFEGTPLYAERGVAEPQRRLYIPVGGGYWQMLERGQAIDPAEAPGDVPGGVPGLDPVGDPRQDAPGPDPELDPEA